MMKQRLISAVLAITFASSVFTVANAGLTERTTNNGNVLLSGIPEIPPEIGRRVARYQNVRGAAFRGWTRHGESMYISTRFGEVSLLHGVDMPLGARNQLTFLQEPVVRAPRRPKGKSIALTMDQGGNEFARIFLLNPKTGLQIVCPMVSPAMAGLFGAMTARQLLCGVPGATVARTMCGSCRLRDQSPFS